MTATTPNNEETGTRARTKPAWYMTKAYVACMAVVFQPAIQKYLAEGVTGLSDLLRKLQAEADCSISDAHLRIWLEELGYADLFSRKTVIKIPAPATKIGAPTSNAASLADELASDLLVEDTRPRGLPPSTEGGPPRIATPPYLSPSAQAEVANQP